MNFKNKFRALNLGLESENDQQPTAPISDEQIMEAVAVEEGDEKSVEDISIGVAPDGEVEIEGTGESPEVAEAIAHQDQLEIVNEAAAARFEANQAHETVAGLEVTLENLKTMRHLVTTMGKNNASLEKAAIGYLNVGLKRHATRLNLESIQLKVPSMESESLLAAETVPADQVDVSEIDKAIEVVEQSIPVAQETANAAEAAATAAEAELPKAAEQAVEIPTDAVQVGVESLTDAEGVEVTETQEPVAPEVLVEGQVEAETEHLTKIIGDESEEILEDRDAISEVRAITEEANAKDGLSVESMAALHLTMEAIHCTAAGREVDLTPGIESYEPGVRYRPSLERIVNNEEEKAGFFLRFAKNYLTNLVRTFDMRADRYVIVRNSMAALLARAQTSRGRPDENARMLINIRSKHLHKAGAIPQSSAEMTEFLVSFYRTSQALQARWHGDANKSIERTLALLNNNLNSGMSEEQIEKALETITAGLKDARDGLPADYRKEIPGGRVWMVDRPNAANHTLANHPRYKRLVKLALTDIPVAAPFNRSGKMDPKQPAPALSPDQVKKIAMEATATLGAWNWKNGFRELASAFNLALLVRSLIWRRRLGRLNSYAGYASHESHEAARLLRRILEVQGSLRFNVAFDAVAETARVSSALYGYASKSLKLMGSVTMEARSEKASTTDLVAVGSLVISGKQSVKVVKVYKKDFEFQGRAYKASADAPKYLVENSKTKKRSVKSGVGLKSA